MKKAKKIKAEKKPPKPCPRCLPLAWAGQIRAETVMPLPGDPPLAEDGSGPCCHDCAAADTVGRLLARRQKLPWAALEPGGPKRPLMEGMPFYALRIVTGNERQEQLRLPENLRRHFGLVSMGIVRASEGDDPLEEHHKWLESVGIRLGGEIESED